MEAVGRGVPDGVLAELYEGGQVAPDDLGAGEELGGEKRCSVLRLVGPSEVGLNDGEDALRDGVLLLARSILSRGSSASWGKRLG